MDYSLENNEKGFTVLELLVGLAISVILLGVAVKITVFQQDAFNEEQEISEMYQNIRTAMSMIVKETKQAGFNPGATSGYTFDGITWINPTLKQLRIMADYNGDQDLPATDDNNEDITYSYDAPGLEIEREDAKGGGAQPIAENIVGFSISYYNEDGIATSTSNEIHQVKVTIIGRTSSIDSRIEYENGVKVDGAYVYGTLTTFITPVNLEYDDDI